MYRMIEENFLKWKKQENHKPLLIYLDQDRWKTYSILNFAKKHYLSYVYINFERDDDIRAFFETDIETARNHDESAGFLP